MDESRIMENMLFVKVGLRKLSQPSDAFWCLGFARTPEGIIAVCFAGMPNERLSMAYAF